MKGIVFTKLNEFVEELWGLEFWDEILQQSKLASGGAYTTVEYYNDQEMFTLIENISAKKKYQWQ
jgi:hypothetical protein